MDKRSVLGFVVIGIILIGWLTYTNYVQKKQQPVKQQTEQPKDSGKISTTFTDTTKKNTPKDTTSLKDTSKVDYATLYGKIFYENAPARAAFAALGLPLGSLIEIETIAAKGQ